MWYGLHLNTYFPEMGGLHKHLSCLGFSPLKEKAVGSAENLDGGEVTLEQPLVVPGVSMLFASCIACEYLRRNL